MSAINAVDGNIVSLFKEDSYFDQYDFMNLLYKLKLQYQEHKVAVFLDNCSIHKTEKAVTYMRENQIERIMNVVYKPQYNGIELLWAKMKQMLRARLLEKKIRNEYFNTRIIIERIMQEIDRD